MTSYVHGELYIIEVMTLYVHCEPYVIKAYQLSEISRKLHNGFLEIATMVRISHTCRVICMKGVVHTSASDLV
jgi:hypothetical protein